MRKRLRLGMENHTSDSPEGSSKIYEYKAVCKASTRQKRAESFANWGLRSYLSVVLPRPKVHMERQTNHSTRNANKIWMVGRGIRCVMSIMHKRGTSYLVEVREKGTSCTNPYRRDWRAGQRDAGSVKYAGSSQAACWLYYYCKLSERIIILTKGGSSITIPGDTAA